MKAYQNLTDAELVTLLQASDHGAYTEIYNRYFKMLFVFIHKRVVDIDEASEIVQDVFVNIWIKRDSLLFNGVLPAYLYTAVRNKMLRSLENVDRQKKYLESLRDYIDQDNAMPDDHIREQQLADLVEKEVEGLPPRMRQVFQMSRNENKSYKQIAEELDLTPMSVKLYGKNALKKLREKLGSALG